MQKHVNIVDLVKSFPTNIYLQNLASIQKITSPIKFAHLAEKPANGSTSNLNQPRFYETVSVLQALELDGQQLDGRVAKVSGAAKRSFGVFEFNFKFPRARTFELFRARSRWWWWWW